MTISRLKTSDMLRRANSISKQITCGSEGLMGLPTKQPIRYQRLITSRTTGLNFPNIGDSSNVAIVEPAMQT